MAIGDFQDEHRDERNDPAVQAEAPRPASMGLFALVLIILFGLGAVEIYSINQIHSLRDSLAATQAALAAAESRTRAEMDQKLSSKLATLQNSNARALDSVKTELDQTAARMGSTGKELKHARTLVTKLQKQQEDNANDLKQEISQKADAQQLGALSEDVSAARTSLDQTKKLVEDTRSDLGMTRSEFGTLIARNHDDIEQLRKLGDRDYFEFTLVRNKQQSVAGVGLVLKKANVKRHRFNLNLVADDMVIEKKDRTINEPVFFSTAASKKFYELVVNQVQSDVVKGYVSTPKGATAIAAERSEGGR